MTLDKGSEAGKFWTRLGNGHGNALPKFSSISSETTSTPHSRANDINMYYPGEPLFNESNSYVRYISFIFYQYFLIFLEQFSRCFIHFQHLNICMLICYI
jgi:hypothetical protein